MHLLVRRGNRSQGYRWERRGQEQFLIVQKGSASVLRKLALRASAVWAPPVFSAVGEYVGHAFVCAGSTSGVGLAFAALRLAKAGPFFALHRFALREAVKSRGRGSLECSASPR